MRLPYFKVKVAACAGEPDYTVTIEITAYSGEIDRMIVRSEEALELWRLFARRWLWPWMGLLLTAVIVLLSIF